MGVGSYSSVAFPFAVHTVLVWAVGFEFHAHHIHTQLLLVYMEDEFIVGPNVN